MYFNKYQGEHSFEKYGLNSIWEVAIDSTTFQGLAIPSEEDVVTLTHFSSGKILSLNRNSQRLSVIPESTDQADEARHPAILSFSPTQPEVLSLSVSCSFKIMVKTNPTGSQSSAKHKNLYLRSSAKTLTLDSLENHPKTVAMNQETKFQHLEDYLYDNQRFVAVCLREDNNDEAFHILRVSEEEKSDCLFIKSCLSILTRHLFNLRANDL